MQKTKQTIKYCVVDNWKTSMSHGQRIRFRFDPVPGTYRHGYGTGRYKSRNHHTYGSMARYSILGWLRKKNNMPSLKSEYWEGEPLRNTSKCWKDQTKRKHQWKPKR